jgi:hypothetical protein
MKRKLIALVIVLLAGCVSLVFCGVPLGYIMPISVRAWPFQVVNQTGETLYLTPIIVQHGEREVGPCNLSESFYISLHQRADFRLAPGETIKLACILRSGSTLQGVVVRGPGGEYGQLTVGKTGHEYMYWDEGGSYVIESLAELPAPSPDALAVARQGSSFNLEVLGEILLGLIPVALFGAALFILWSLWRELRRGAADETLITNQESSHESRR